MGKLYGHAYVKNMMAIPLSRDSLECEDISSLARIGNKTYEAGIDIIFGYLESL